MFVLVRTADTREVYIWQLGGQLPLGFGRRAALGDFRRGQRLHSIGIP